MSVRLIVAAAVGVVAGYVGSGFTSFNPQAAATGFSLVPGFGGTLSPSA